MTCACSSALLAYIGLGSNTPDAPQRLTTASEALDRLEGLHVLRASSRYSTEPQGYAGQPWFENAVLEVAVDSRRWQPRELLAARLGRCRVTTPGVCCRIRACASGPLCLYPWPSWPRGCW